MLCTTNLYLLSFYEKTIIHKLQYVIIIVFILKYQTFYFVNFVLNRLKSKYDGNENC